jgi:ribonuclease R
MQQAVYTPDNIGHFGLAFEAYCHFTSPIRRYPDLLTHRAIKAILQGKRYEPKGIQVAKLNSAISNAARKQQAKDKIAGTQKREQDQTIWDALGVHCSANERRADEASRDVEAWLKCYYIRDKLGEEFTGTISAVTSFGIFVQLDTLFIEGLVHITELGADYFQYDEVRHELRGERTGRRFQLTDRVTVQVSRVDLEARKIDLCLVELGQPLGAKGGGRMDGKPGGASSRSGNAASSGASNGASNAASSGANTGRKVSNNVSNNASKDSHSDGTLDYGLPSRRQRGSQANNAGESHVMREGERKGSAKTVKNGKAPARNVGKPGVGKVKSASSGLSRKKRK